VRKALTKWLAGLSRPAKTGPVGTNRRPRRKTPSRAETTLIATAGQMTTTTTKVKRPAAQAWT
jgi:hypothetical protein